MTWKVLLLSGGLANSQFVGQEDWQLYKERFGKHYESEEDGLRYGVFAANLKFVLTENAKGHSYKLGVNQFTDIPKEEFLSHYTGLREPSTINIFGDAPYLGEHTWNGDDLPDAVDWTNKGAVTAIKNQGQCGSCWTFSATGALEGAYFLATGNLVSLSEQQIVDCDHSIFPPTLGCNGGSMSAAFKYAEKNAMCTEESYPYEAKNGNCRTDGCSVGIQQGEVTGYKGLATIARIIPASEEVLMSAVAQQPVSIGIEADQDAFQQYASGILTGDCGSKVDHGVLLVGYGTDGGEYWKVKNSWGASWGESGYVRLEKGSSSRMGKCGIRSSPSYPIITARSDVVV